MSRDDHETPSGGPDPNPFATAGEGRPAFPPLSSSIDSSIVSEASTTPPTPAMETASSLSALSPFAQAAHAAMASGGAGHGLGFKASGTLSSSLSAASLKHSLRAPLESSVSTADSHDGGGTAGPPDAPTKPRRGSGRSSSMPPSPFALSDAHRVPSVALRPVPEGLQLGGTSPGQVSSEAATPQLSRAPRRLEAAFDQVASVGGRGEVLSGGVASLGAHFSEAPHRSSSEQHHSFPASFSVGSGVSAAVPTSPEIPHHPTHAQMQAAALAALAPLPPLHAPPDRAASAAAALGGGPVGMGLTIAQQLQLQQHLAAAGAVRPVPPASPTLASPYAFSPTPDAFLGGYSASTPLPHAATPRSSMSRPPSGPLSPGSISSQLSWGGTTPRRSSSSVGAGHGWAAVATPEAFLPLPFPAARYSISLDSVWGISTAPGDDVIQQALMGLGLGLGGGVSDSAASMLAALQARAATRPQVRALLGAGGRFSAGPRGQTGYEGGDLRLVSLPEGCSFAELVAVLARSDRGAGPRASTAAATLASSYPPRTSVSGFGRTLSSRSFAASPPGSVRNSRNSATGGSGGVPAGDVGSGGGAGSISSPRLSSAATAAAAAAAAAALVAAQSPAAQAQAAALARSHVTLRYQLPTDPSVFVDVLDDEDVRLMFEELADVRQTQGAAAPKLRLYVQWGPGSSGAGQSTSAAAAAASEMAATTTARSSDEFHTAPDSVYSGHAGGSDTSLDSADECVEGAEGGEGEGSVAGDAAKTAASALPSPPPTVHAAHRSASDLRLAAVRSDQLEIIPAGEVILTELLGTGAFGDMWRGTWRECPVAVKCLNPGTVGLQYASQEAWLEFLKDANASAALRHPGLVEVYGIVLPGTEAPKDNLSPTKQRNHRADEEETKLGGRRTAWDFSASSVVASEAHLAIVAGAAASTPAYCGLQRLPGPVACPPAIVMEYVSGRSLRGAIERGDDSVQGPLARVIYALDVSRAMAYLHSRGIPHYDLKSANVLLGWRNLRPAAKVAGYGLSSRQTALSTYTPGLTCSPGVFPWTAPEILRRPDAVGPPADVYSFAIILWELWALNAPYEALDLRHLISKAANTDEIVRPQMPPLGGVAEPAPGWADLVQRCWAEEPTERPAFEEIEKELRGMARAVKEAQRRPEERKHGGGGGKAEQ